MKRSTFLVAAVSLALLPALALAGTTGKIAGKVVDAKTGEPLPGANVIVEGTTLGAATGANGEYFIINVPVGTYTLRATMIGYQAQVVKDVRVNIDLTTRVDFKLPQQVIEMGEVVVTATRPMVAKEVTSSVHIKSAEEFQHLPVTNTQQVVQITAGVDGASFRGGLGNEVTYLVDGLSINDPMYHTASTYVNLNAVQEIQVSTGAYNAEYGEAMSGIVNIVTKEGGSRTSLIYEIETDRASAPLFGEEYDNGYVKNELSWGGPIPFLGRKFRYFIAANTLYAKVNNPRQYEFMHYDWDHKYPNGIKRKYYVPHNKREDYGTNFKFSYLQSPNIKWRLGGFLNRNQWERPLYEGTSQTSERSYLFKEDDFDVNTQKTYQVYLNLTHQLTPKTFYDLRAVRFRTFRQTGLQADLDRTWKDFFKDYEYRGLDEYHQQDWSNPENPMGVYNMFQARDATGRIYELRKEAYWGVKLDAVSQITLNHQLKSGIEFNYHTVRRYRNTLPWDPEPFLQIYGYQVLVDTLADGSVRRTIQEYDGNENVTWLKYKPFHPWTLAWYFQDTMEYPGFIVNAGVRFDAFYASAEKRKDPYDWYSETEPVSVKWRISPRLGISHPVSDRTKLHIFYGKFFQTPNFNDLFLNLDPYITRSYSGVGNPDLEAMKTTSYEIGIEHQLMEDVAISLTAYYKDMYDLMGNRPILAVPFNYIHRDNYDFANAKGVEFVLRKRLSNYFRTEANFSYWKRDRQIVPSFSQIAQGEIDPRTGKLYPRRFRLKGTYHYRGNWQLDIVFPKDFGPSFFGLLPLQNSYASFITTIRSGNYYTRTDSRGEPVGDYFAAQMPLRLQTDMEINKDFLVGGLRLSVFARVINLFGRQNILGLYTRTGRPDDTGKIINESNFRDGISRWKDKAAGIENPNWKWEYVKDLDGDEHISAHEEYLAYKAAYKFLTTNPSFYGAARQIHLGLRIQL